jgi:hypothetical protein
MGYISIKIKRKNGGRRLSTSCQIQEDSYMKKALVLLLILAVAGGVFAEGGEFSWTGEAKLKAKISLPIDGVKESYIGPTGDNLGKVDLAYTKEGLELGLGFQTRYLDDGTYAGDNHLNASVAYTGDTLAGDGAQYYLKATSNLTKLGAGDGVALKAGDIYGWYQFLGGGLQLDVSYRGGGNGTWSVSTLVVEEFGLGDAPRKFDKLDDHAGVQFTFTGIEGIKAGAQFGIGKWNSPVEVPLDELVNGFFKHASFGFSFNDMVSLQLGLTEPAGGKNPILDMHVGFAMGLSDALSVNADILLANLTSDKAESERMGVAIGAGAKFVAAPITAGIDMTFVDFIGYESGAKDTLITTLSPYVNVVISEALEAGADLEFEIAKEVFNISIGPYVNVKVAKDTAINFGYNIDFNKDGKITDHNITTAFTWSF